MEMAAVIFSQQEQSGDLTACTATDPNTGNSITFNSSQAMFDMIDDPNASEALMNYFAQAASLAYGVASYVDDLSQLTKGLSKASGYFSGAVLAIDAMQALENPNADTISDVVIDLVSFAGPQGAVISVGLTYGKQGIVASATGMAKFSIAYEKWYVNRWSQALFGVNIR